MSDRLISCPKFKALTVDKRADAVIKKVCASCLSWNHERATCTKPLKCKETGCTGNHNTLLHGTKNPKVMTARVKNTVVPSFNNLYYNSDQGMLETVLYIFEESNTGTVILFDSGSVFIVLARPDLRLQ